MRPDGTGLVRHIFVAAMRGAPMLARTEVRVQKDRVLYGDRYADPTIRRSSNYPLTLIELEHIEAFQAASGLPLAPYEPRRNLVTEGADLNSLLGRRFTVGEVELEGIELCEPCGLFARRTHAEVLKFFVHKGGLGARILTDGIIRTGDRISAL
jgi:MOSC domain-containing protein YiiM